MSSLRIISLFSLINSFFFKLYTVLKWYGDRKVAHLISWAMLNFSKNCIKKMETILYSLVLIRDSVQNLLSSRLLSKNLKIKIYRTIILPVVLYGCETWSLTLRDERKLRVFRTWCWGEYLNLGGPRYRGNGGDCITRS